MFTILFLSFSETLSKVKGAFSRKKNSVEQDQGANVCLMRDSPFRIFKVGRLSLLKLFIIVH